MRLFHRHKWVEIGRTFNAPGPEPYGAWSNPLRNTYGFTNIFLSCSSCGDVKAHSVVGKCEK